MSNRSAEIFELLKEIAAEVAQLNPSNIDKTARLIDDLGLDSVDFFDIIALLNKRLNQSFFIQDLSSIITVEDFILKIEELLSEQPINSKKS